MWQQASSRLTLKLVPFRVLARTFAPISTTIPHIKHLHDDTKKPDSDLESKTEDSPADDKFKLEAQNIVADSESDLEHAGPEAIEDGAETTATQKGKKWKSDAQRIAGLANLQKARERQRAAGFPSLQKALDTRRAMGFPQSKKSLENQRAQRAAGFPNLQKGWDAHRAAGFPNLRKNPEARHVSIQAGHKRYHAEQRALGYEEYRKQRHAKLLLDIEAANKRKLAEDPTFIPNPLPDLESLPRISYQRRVGTVPCPEPGCDSKFKNEQTLARHIRSMHSCYSIETPHKCKDSSCNKYFPTKQKASEHFSSVHRRQKPPCPICDRIFCNSSAMREHLLLVHGIKPSPG